MPSFTIIFSLVIAVAIAVRPSNAERNRSRKQQFSCDELDACYLVNAKTLKDVTKISRDSGKVTTYELDPTNELGYSVRCEVEGKLSAGSDFIVFRWEDMAHTEWAYPRYMFGSSNQGAFINPVPYLGTCGTKTFSVEGNIWVSKCFVQEYVMNAVNADGKVCDGAPTLAPAIAAPVTKPVATPLKAPIAAPVTAPVKAPVAAPVRAPRRAPVAAPTRAPRKAPVTAPVRAPRKAPVAAPTRAPRKAPVAAPVRAPRKAPVAAPTRAPRKAPVRAPRTPPVSAPVRPPRKSPIAAPVKPPKKAPVPVPVKAPTSTPVTAPIKAPTSAPRKPPVKPPVRPPFRLDPPVPTGSTTCGKNQILKNGRCIFAPIRYLLNKLFGSKK